MGSMPRPHFRAGVVLAVQRDDGELLCFERTDPVGQWQLPQGGIDPGESPEQAAWRELEEETGLGSKHVRLTGEHPLWTVYQWPHGPTDKERYGQVHRWFFFRPIIDELTPTPDGHEFRDWRWMTPGSLIDQVVDFRVAPYKQVLGG